MSKDTLRLRAMEPTDIRFIARMENLEESCRYSDRVAPLSVESVSAYVMTCDPDPFHSGQLRLVVCLKEEAVGLLDFFDISLIHRRANVGIVVAPEFRFQGLGSRTLRIACKFAKERLRLLSLGAIVSILNPRSLKAFENAGFEERGILKDWWRTHDSAEDCVMLQKML